MGCKTVPLVMAYARSELMIQTHCRIIIPTIVASSHFWGEESVAHSGRNYTLSGTSVESSVGTNSRCICSS